MLRVLTVSLTHKVGAGGGGGGSREAGVTEFDRLWRKWLGSTCRWGWLILGGWDQGLHHLGFHPIGSHPSAAGCSSLGLFAVAKEKITKWLVIREFIHSLATLLGVAWISVWHCWGTIEPSVSLDCWIRQFLIFLLQMYWDFFKSQYT